MAYIDEMKKQGNWLFRWRSFLPLIIMLLFPIGLRHSTYFMGSILLDRLWELSCFTISLAGLAIRIYTVGYVPAGTSGRTTSNPKAEELNTTGMYSIVRHPLYLGNCVIWAGIAVLPRSTLLMVACVLAFCLYYERIIVAEEAFLSEKFGLAFAQWAEKVPVMIPKIKLWIRPARSFSWQAVLEREYPGFFAITASFALIDALIDWFRDAEWELDWLWVVIFCIGLLVFVVSLTLKKLGITKPCQNPPYQIKTAQT
ncbi:MAG: isoprenylcysteine carboxylmethyltransferase family protein [Sedimentisphaerales bacterium]|jgi:protein-S-isoprenylcysteine O-methyltransferase Ste14